MRGRDMTDLDEADAIVVFDVVVTAAVTDGAAVTDAAVTDGAVTDGAVIDGAVTDGAVTDGAVDESKGEDEDECEIVFPSLTKEGAAGEATELLWKVPETDSSRLVWLLLLLTLSKCICDVGNTADEDEEEDSDEEDDSDEDDTIFVDVLPPGTPRGRAEMDAFIISTALPKPN